MLFTLLQGVETLLQLKWQLNLDVMLIVQQRMVAHHYILQLKDTLVIRELITLGANVNARREPDGSAPIHVAAERGSVSVLEEMIRLNLPITQKTSDGSTALHVAAYFGQTAMIRRLIDRGLLVEDMAKLNTPLLSAVKGGNSAAVRALLERGAHVDTRVGDWTPLLWALSHGHDIAAILVDYNASIKSEGYWGTFILLSPFLFFSLLLALAGYRPIHFAVKFKNDRIVKMLIEHGANLEARANWNKSHSGSVHSSFWFLLLVLTSIP